MTDLMHREMEEVFYMITGGMAVMMVFGAKDLVLNRVKAYRRLYGFLYLCFWLFASYLFCAFLYRGSYGVISWYTLPAFAGGCILWKKGFCGILNLYETAQKYNGDKKHEKKNKRAGQGFRSAKKRRY